MKWNPPTPQKHDPLTAGHGAEGEQVSVFCPNRLIEAGVLEDVPHSHHPDHFCMAVSTQFLAGQADLGAALLRVNSRGHWQTLGGFLDLYDLGNKLDGQRSPLLPKLMEAMREGHSRPTLTEVAQQSGVHFDGHLFAIGLARPHFGVLVIGSVSPLEFSPNGLKLLTAVTETWLGRGEYSSASTSSIPQVNSENKTVIFNDRQLEVLRLLAEGATNTEIGKRLFISASLGKQEVAFLAHALQANNRLDTVIQAQRQGILPVG